MLGDPLCPPHWNISARAAFRHEITKIVALCFRDVACRGLPAVSGLAAESHCDDNARLRIGADHPFGCSPESLNSRGRGLEKYARHGSLALSDLRCYKFRIFCRGSGVELAAPSFHQRIARQFVPSWLIFPPTGEIGVIETSKRSSMKFYSLRMWMYQGRFP